MKFSTKATILFFTLVITAFTFSCEKEETPNVDAYSQEVETIYSLIQEIEATHEHDFNLDKDAIKNALPIANAMKTISDCCYTSTELLDFLGCYGSTSKYCLNTWDFDSDGDVDAIDLVCFSSNYGCQNIVPVYSNFGTGIAVTSQFTAQIRNYTLVDGDLWYFNPEDIDAVRWYYDGALVSTAFTHLQLQYPGASASDYDVAITCNHGWHEITMEIEADCQVYSISSCAQVKMLATPALPTCTTDYCTPE